MRITYEDKDKVILEQGMVLPLPTVILLLMGVVTLIFVFAYPNYFAYPYPEFIIFLPLIFLLGSILAYFIHKEYYKIEVDKRTKKLTILEDRRTAKIIQFYNFKDIIAIEIRSDTYRRFTLLEVIGHGYFSRFKRPIYEISIISGNQKHFLYYCLTYTYNSRFSEKSNCKRIADFIEVKFIDKTNLSKNQK